MKPLHRYQRFLRRARVEDLSDIAAHRCIYQSGVDIYGRPIVVFVARNFPASLVDLEKVLCLCVPILCTHFMYPFAELSNCRHQIIIMFHIFYIYTEMFLILHKPLFYISFFLPGLSVLCVPPRSHRQSRLCRHLLSHVKHSQEPAWLEMAETSLPRCRQAISQIPKGLLYCTSYILVTGKSWARLKHREEFPSYHIQQNTTQNSQFAHQILRLSVQKSLFFMILLSFTACVMVLHHLHSIQY